MNLNASPLSFNPILRNSNLRRAVAVLMVKVALAPPFSVCHHCQMSTAKPPKTGHGNVRLRHLRVKDMERTITEHLMQRYGPLLDAKALAETLKFATVDALERSLERGHLRIATSDMPHRRGKFALAHQVAQYLVEGVTEQDFQVNAEMADLGKERPP
jgi:hypothetical protein